MNTTEKDKNSQSEAARLYEESSEKNRNLFLFYLVVIAYILIIVASTTDLELLLPKSFITLPVLSVGIPLTYFYVLSSPLVLILHFNLLHNTTEHQKKIKQWEKEKSINLLHSTIEHQKKIKQWKKEEFISSHLMHPYIFDFAYLSPSERWGNILVYSTSFLLYFLAPVCLFCIQLRFSDYQSLGYSSVHLSCLLIDLYFLILFFSETHNSSRKKQDSGNSNGVASFLKFFKCKDIDELFRKFVITLIFFVGVFYFGIVGMLQFDMTIEWLEKSRERIPRIVIPPGTKIQKQNLEELKLIATQVDTNETNAWKNHGENYNLTGRRLVFSDFRRCYMLKIVLDGTYLQGSYMQNAHMQGASINGANMQRAKMFGVKLQGADILRAYLQGADMSRAELQNADMFRANLQNTIMIGTKLQGADMRGAELQGANMEKAELEGADMRETELQGANMEKAKLQSADIRGEELQGADMEKAQLQGADMRGAKLQGANMKEAKLQGANMRGAKLQGADMSRAKLQGADMRGAELQGANMQEAQLQGANIRGAKFFGANMKDASLRGNFCKEKTYDSFFDQMNARIGKRGLQGCNTMDDSQFGVLDQDTANGIIKSLRSNGNVSEGITDEIKKNINNRVGEAPSMVEVKKGKLKLKEVCKIIADWPENLEYAPGLKKTFVGWLNTKAGKKSRLKKCSMPI